MEKEIKPLIVALDTSIFEEANLFFNGRDFDLLKRYIQEGIILNLLISDVVIAELEKHFRERIRNLNNRIQSIIDSREVNILSVTNSIKGYFKKIDEEKVFFEMRNVLNQFLKETNSIILPSDKIKIKDILDNYFSGAAPFGSGQKKAEFPDAIIIKQIKEALKTYDRIVVVSNDPDWKKAIDGINEITYYKSLSDLFESIPKEQILKLEVQNFYRKHAGDINKEILDKLYHISYEVDGYICDRKGIIEGNEYTDVYLSDLEIESYLIGIDYINDNEIVTRINVEAFYKFECEYMDEEESIWDSEIKDYFYRKYNYVMEEHKRYFPVSVIYKVKEKEIESHKEINLFSLGNKLTFNHQSLISRVPMRTNEFQFKCIHNYNCPNCNNLIELDLMDHVESSNVIGERGMGEEIEHAIEYEDECPSCKKSFKISGSIYEYPVGAFNYDDTKIEWK